jgi:hypothetical protein
MNKGKSNQNKFKKVINIHSINLNLKIYSLYWILIGFTIVLGTFFQIIFYIKPKDINRFILGINFLKIHNFLFPLLFNFLFFFWILYIFYANATLRLEFRRSVFLYLKKLRCCFFFTNITLYILYHFILDRVIFPVRTRTGFKMSKEIIQVMFSGALISHLDYISHEFLTAKINIELMNYISYICHFFHYHNIYIIFWSSWVFCNLTELFISYFICIIYISFIHFCSIDKLFLVLIDFSNHNQKKRNILYGRNDIYY